MHKHQLAARDESPPAPAGGLKERGKGRNNTIDIMRLIASFCVIVLHSFTCSGLWASEEIVSVTRFAVPLFFMFSGYFAANFTVKRKLLQILKVFLIGAAANLFYMTLDLSNQPGWIFMQIRLRKLLLPSAVKDFAIYNESPFSGHLWFLGGLLYVLIIDLVLSWVFGGLKPKHKNLITAIAASLLMVGGAAVYFARDLRLVEYRNFLLFGLPFFLFGKVIRRVDFTRLRVPAPVYPGVILGAALLSIFEFRMYGARELYIGAVIQAFVLMHLALSHPLKDCGGLIRGISLLGRYTSLLVYIIHPYLLSTVRDLYYTRFPWDASGPNLFYAVPLVVFVLSVLVGLVPVGVAYGIRAARSMIKGKSAPKDMSI